jgi:hypothetical protein
MARLRARLRLLAARNVDGAAQKASLAAVGLLSQCMKSRSPQLLL